MRSAEKKRNSTCQLADSVAELVLNAYRSSDPFIEGSVPPQTVCAGFCILNRNVTDRPLRLVSWATGTKFVPPDILATDLEGKLVRDSHAEPLARRGLLRFLWVELHKAKAGQESVLKPADQMDVESANSFYMLDPNMELLMYSSSMPCGNASLKRWAKGKKEVHRHELGPLSYPCEQHPHLHITAQAEGQVALLLKGEALRETAGEASTAVVANLCQQETKSKGREGTIAPGTRRPTGLELGTMTCSDKIARWSVLGIQGALLSRWIQPIYMAGIIIGRKFSFEHARRALCCRLVGRKRKAPSGSKSVNGEAMYSLHHPSLMGTAVKLDEKVICTDAQKGASSGATFGNGDGNSPCLVWTAGDPGPERIDGRRGTSLDASDGISTVSRRALYAHFVRATVSDEGMPSKEMGYQHAKLQHASRNYTQARNDLIGPNGLFSDWIHSRLDDWTLNAFEYDEAVAQLESSISPPPFNSENKEEENDRTFGEV